VKFRARVYSRENSAEVDLSYHGKQRSAQRTEATEQAIQHTSSTANLLADLRDENGEIELGNPAKND